MKLDIKLSEPIPSSVLKCLSTRGRQPTQLVVSAYDRLSSSAEAHSRTVLLCHALQPRGHVISSLYYEGFITHPEIPSLLAHTFPALSTLHIDILTGPLPPQAALPQLTDLLIARVDSAGAGHSAVDILHSIAAYLPQITRLGVNADGECDPVDTWVWRQLLTPATAFLRLTHIDTKVRMDDEFVGLVLQYAPNLRTLVVAGACIGHTQHTLPTG